MISVEGVGRSGVKLAEEREEWSDVVWSVGCEVGRWMKSCVDGGMADIRAEGIGRGKTRWIVKGGEGNEVALDMSAVVERVAR